MKESTKDRLWEIYQDGWMTFVIWSFRIGIWLTWGATLTSLLIDVEPPSTNLQSLLTVPAYTFMEFLYKRYWKQHPVS